MKALIGYLLFVAALIILGIWLNTLPEVKKYNEEHKDDPSNWNCGIGAMKKPFMKCYTNGTTVR